MQSRWSKLGDNFPKNDFPEEIKNDKFSFEHIPVHVCWWSLTVSVRNLTLAMSTEPICSCELGGCWLVCQAEHCSDAEQCGWGSGWAITTAQHQASWYHLSVQWHSPLSHTCFKGIGFRVFAGFVSAHVWVRECGSMRDWACQPLIYSPEPWNMLQSAPERARDLPLGIWHGKKQSQNKGINTTIVFLGRHNIYAVQQVAYCCKRGFQLIYCQIRNKNLQTSANDQLSHKIHLQAQMWKVPSNYKIWTSWRKLQAMIV